MNLYEGLKIKVGVEDYLGVTTINVYQKVITRFLSEGIQEGDLSETTLIIKSLDCKNYWNQLNIKGQ